MADRWGLGVRGIRSESVPSGFYEWEGYRLPVESDSFGWEQLVDVGAANGLDIGHATVRKWRQRRFLPAPRPGGPTGKGPGKGERWSFEAAIRAAWLSRWQYDTLSYDALRVAMWPWTPELERDRAAELLASVLAFFRQDQDFHSRKIGVDTSWTGDAATIDYFDVVMDGTSTPEQRERLLQSGGMPPDDPHYAETVAFLAAMNFPTMHRVLHALDANDLGQFIADFRLQKMPDFQSFGDFVTSHASSDVAQTLRLGTVEEARWTTPLGLARIVVRQLFFQKLRAEPLEIQPREQ